MTMQASNYFTETQRRCFPVWRTAVLTAVFAPRHTGSLCGLRDYGTAKWEGGSADCDHVYNHGVQGKSGDRADRTFTAQAVYRDECRKCGAIRIDKQLGLEATPEEYVSKIVEVFREVRRVLREDGTLWLNLGDSYATGAGKVGDCPGGGEQGERWKQKQDFYNGHKGSRGGSTKQPHTGASVGPLVQPNRLPIPGLKAKDMVGIPWMVAFALRADGWYLRSEIIWHKQNPMPESVTDRPTKSHEQIFLLAKSERYYYDADAIAEPCYPEVIDRTPAGWHQGTRPATPSGMRDSAKRGSFNGKTEALAKEGRNAFRAVTETRNKRTVWTVGTSPFPEAHFATFAPELIFPCVLAGCPSGGTILDPFSGAATTAMVAKANGRKCIGIELNEEYLKISAKRLSQDVLDFGERPLDLDGGEPVVSPE